MAEAKFEIKNLDLKIVLLSTAVVVASSGILLFLDVKYDIFSRWYAEDNDEEEQYEEVEEEYVYEEITVSGAEASSCLTGTSGNVYGIELTTDNSIETSWQDGQAGDGIGETLTYRFEDIASIVEIGILNGNAKSEENYYENNRIQDAYIYFYLDDEIVYEGNAHFDDVYAVEPTYFTLEEFVECNLVVIRMDSIYEGSLYEDLCVSEVKFEQAVLSE